ncbi:hypothetical protein JQ604_23605 [Bradyrhizobium jicamae]|uniref:hypothetical protein n=1 Tax=Bradyrhizobium jicamae TaxID=280332 RepID=UPI001BA72D6F|nr:hypothetical protein [Bradyrhizobium jicamae]MBR0755182.1 hypothetical protein [Bradyrhizobium jicamae]
MKRIVTAALLATSVGLLVAPDQVQAQTAAPGMRMAQADVVVVRRKPKRVPIYRSTPYPQDHWDPDVIPRYNPGPNAVRDCTATYVQEYRPSGTVITPRMNCYWRPG